MIQKVGQFFTTYNIVVGLVITILSIFSVEIIKSCANDVILPILHANIDTKTITIRNKEIKIGLFISAILRLFFAIIIIFIIIHIHPHSINHK